MDIPTFMSPYCDLNYESKIFQSAREMKASGLIEYSRMGENDSLLEWTDIESRYRDKKALLIIFGYFADGDSIGHTVAVRFDMGVSGVIMDGCHSEKVGGGIAYNFTIDTAQLFMSYPSKVFAFFPCSQ
jgi:hypothetical protein